MTEPRVEVREYVYTENVYFDADGNEFARDRNYDDTWLGTCEGRAMTEQELEDWGLADDH